MDIPRRTMKCQICGLGLRWSFKLTCWLHDHFEPLTDLHAPVPDWPVRDLIQVKGKKLIYPEDIIDFIEAATGLLVDPEDS